MGNVRNVFKRELAAYFNSPLAYVFIFIFVLMAMGLAFVFGRFIENGEASLTWSFFAFHPWLFMILGPAVGMRLWSEEHRLGTIELLLTMPISPWQAILGKFLAACVVMFASLLLTFPIVITLYYLGEPDFGTIAAGYLGSFLIGCATVAICCVVSAFTRSQVACLVVSVAICFALVMAGFDPVITFLQQSGMNVLAGFFSSIGFTWHARLMNEGLILPSSIFYLLSVIAFCLFTTAVVIRSKRS